MDAVRMKEVPSEVEHREKVARDKGKRRNAREAMEASKVAFRGKHFADLTQEEKDDLLKALAIAAGIISE